MSNNPVANPEMKYSRPGGMPPNEQDKIRRRLGGGVPTPNASGATQQEAPAILAGSEPSRELRPPVLTPEEIEATAKANREARAAQMEAHHKARAAQPLQADPINGEVDPLDAGPGDDEGDEEDEVHAAAVDDLMK
jgi:hypothetical protein